MFSVPHIPLSISSRLKMASIALAGSIQGYVQATRLLAQSKTGVAPGGPGIHWTPVVDPGSGPGSAALTPASSRASEQPTRYITYVKLGTN